MVEEAWYYKEPDNTVRPGDIIALAPIYKALASPLCLASPNKNAKKGRAYCEIWGLPDGGAIPKRVNQGGKECVFLVDGIREQYAVLLTRGCDIESGKVRQVAPVRPLTLIQGGGGRTAEQNRAAVIDGQHMSLHYLPESNLFPDSFLDFRYVATIRRDLFDTFERPLALSRDALFDLYMSWVTHTTGKKVPAEGRCPSCQGVVHFLRDVDQVLQPPLDY